MNGQDLKRVMENILMEQNAKDKVLQNVLNHNTERKNNFMSKKKIAIIATAACLVLGVAVYAASSIVTSWHSWSSSRPEFDSVPTQEEYIKEIGFVPNTPESFKNGYVFDNASVVSNELEGENGENIEKFKSITARYLKDGDKLLLSAVKRKTPLEHEGEVIAEKNGVELAYNSYTNKIVPPDYKLTEEDKRAEESGELVFSYGSEKVNIIEVQGLSWYTDGIYYGFVQMDGQLTAEELVEMAKEMIN